MTTLLNRKTQPTIKPPKRIDFPQPEIHQLKNGIKVHQFNAGAQDVISIEMVFKAGSWFQDKPFTAMATNLMLREGTRNFTARELSESLDFFGAHLENTAERDNAYVTLYSLNKHLDNTLPLLSEIVKNPVFPENDFNVLAGKQFQQLEVNRQKVNFLARTHFNSFIFGKNHPYGMFLVPDDIGKVTNLDLAAFHKSQYHSGNCTIVVAGLIKPGLIDALESHFGGNDWSGNPSVQLYSELNGSDQKNHFIAKEGAMQSAIRMGCLALLYLSLPDAQSRECRDRQ